MKLLPYIVIIFLLLVIFFQRECNSNLHEKSFNDHTVEVVVHDTVTDTVIIESVSYKPYYVYKDTGSTKYIILPIDTLKVISDYYSKYFCTDTLQNDSNALIIVEDTILMNRIVSRKSLVQVYPRTLSQTKLVTINPKLKGRLLLGTQVCFHSNSAGFAPSLLYQSKKQSVISFSYDIFNNDFIVGFYWPIRLKRR